MVISIISIYIVISSFKIYYQVEIAKTISSFESLNLVLISYLIITNKWKSHVNILNIYYIIVI